MTPSFPPTRAAALAGLGAMRTQSYASSRNHLDGAVTRLSPYLTHGLLNLPEVAALAAARHALPIEHKFVQELAWREFFQHVWSHQGEAIFTSLHEGPRPEAAYASSVPDDIRQARTGLPVIDQAVRQLYAVGWLHNHARMWLASYVVHVRGVHWRAGADWLVAHLLDGDLASNHLSWQWIAGTGSHKPYLFNADNVARHVGNAQGWASPGSVVDTDYATIERWARGTAALPPAPPAGRPGGVDEPALGHRPPADLAVPALLTAPQATALGKTLAGRDVWLVHPWALVDPVGGSRSGTPGQVLRLGVWPAEFFARWAWSAARWRFVATAMAAATDQRVWADSATLHTVLGRAASVRCTDNGHLPADWPADWRQPAPRLLPEPDRACSSFSQFWRQATAGYAKHQAWHRVMAAEQADPLDEADAADACDD